MTALAVAARNNNSLPLTVTVRIPYRLPHPYRLTAPALDGTGLDGPGRDWTGRGWTGLDGTGLDGIGREWTGWDWTGPDKTLSLMFTIVVLIFC